VKRSTGAGLALFGPIALAILAVVVLGRDIAALGDARRVHASPPAVGLTNDRLEAAPAPIHESAFPSSSCRFAVPSGWPVVWSDLDRGAAWHSEARSPSVPLAHIGCDVLHQSAPPAVAARAAQADARLMPGYRELGFRPRTIAGAPAVEWQFRHVVAGRPVDVTRVYLPAGTVLELQAPAGGDRTLTAAFAETIASFGGHSQAPAATAPVALTPPDGARVSAPPILTWPATKGATYYNVQVFDGTERVDEAWPLRPGHRLPAGALHRGRTYTWYVWAATGPRSAPRFGAPTGRASFTYRP
jgi:hypothetical protein